MSATARLAELAGVARVLEGAALDREHERVDRRQLGPSAERHGLVDLDRDVLAVGHARRRAAMRSTSATMVGWSNSTMVNVSGVTVTAIVRPRRPRPSAGGAARSW